MFPLPRPLGQSESGFHVGIPAAAETAGASVPWAWLREFALGWENMGLIVVNSSF